MYSSADDWTANAETLEAIYHVMCEFNIHVHVHVCTHVYT